MEERRIGSLKAQLSGALKVLRLCGLLGLLFARGG